MKRAILLTCLSAAAMLTVAGCGKTIVRETVVEKPVVKEVVVEKPVVQRETIVQMPEMCSVAGNTYSQGSMSCQGGEEYRCNRGAWERTGRYC
jgi:hypothetical protein